MGPVKFKKHYRRNLVEWINPEKTFARLKRLGINAVKIPVPEDLMLPLEKGIEFFETVHSMLNITEMAEGFQYGLVMLDKAFDAADKHQIGIYISNYAREGGNKNDASNWLLGIKYMMERYRKRKSFIGIDLLNQPKIDQNLLAKYWKKGYEVVRSYEKLHKLTSTCLIFISDR